MFIGYRFEHRIRMLKEISHGKFAFVSVNASLKQKSDRSVTWRSTTREIAIATAEKGGREIHTFDLSTSFIEHFWPTPIPAVPVMPPPPLPTIPPPHFKHKGTRTGRITMNQQATATMQFTPSCPTFETKHYFDGVDISQMSTEQFVHKVAEIEAQLDYLSSLTSKSKKIDKEIKKLRKGLANAIEIFDA